MQFTVYGKPIQMGSKRAFMRGNRAILTDDNSKTRKQWANAVATAAAESMGEQELFRDPVRVGVKFYFSRPGSHYGTGRNSDKLKPSAPAIHGQSPDIDKLLRCLFDAMTGVVYGDDRQVWKVEASRVWTTSQAKAEVSVCGLVTQKGEQCSD